MNNHKSPFHWYFLTATCCREGGANIGPYVRSYNGHVEFLQRLSLLMENRNVNPIVGFGHHSLSSTVFSGATVGFSSSCPAKIYRYRGGGVHKNVVKVLLSSFEFYTTQF